MADIVSRQAFALPRAVAENIEVFAIGDIHGRPDLLEALLDEAAREPRLRERRAIIFLGDLIDRGPDSLGAVDLAAGAGERLGATDAINLMGNHEAMLRLALDPQTPWDAAVGALAGWLGNGGVSVMRQFIEPGRLPRDPDELLTVLRAQAPARLFDWLSELSAHAVSGAVLFVHAGVNPHIYLEDFLATPWNIPLDQLDEDRHWAWVRWPFLDRRPGPDGFSGLFVVHGHTPNDARRTASPAEQIARFRLNLDAGSGRTGQVRMAILRDDEATVVSAMGLTDRALAGREGPRSA